MANYLKQFDEKFNIVDNFGKTNNTKAWVISNGGAWAYSKRAMYFYDFGIIVLKLKDKAPNVYCSRMQNEFKIGAKYNGIEGAYNFMLSIGNEVIDIDRIDSCVVYMEREGFSSLFVYTEKTFQEYGLRILWYPQNYLELRFAALTYMSQILADDSQYMMAYNFINDEEKDYAY